MMNKKSVRRILLTIGLLALAVVLINLGFNLFLKYKLPSYIENNSDYILSYESLNVELGNGSVHLENLEIASKNPANKDVIGLNGSVKSVYVSQLGIWKAITGKSIQASSLVLNSPNLQVTLAKPRDSKTGKKRSPMPFRNITIDNGNIKVTKPAGERFLEVEDLNLKVTNLQLSEKGIESKLPVVFDKYDIQGNKFYFQLEELYAIQANHITTKNGKMSIKGFEIVTSVSYENFVKLYPKKPNMLSVKSRELNFTDLALKKNTLSLSRAEFIDPVITIRSNRTAVKTEKKPFQFILDLQDVELKNAKVNLLKPNGVTAFSAGQLDLEIHKLRMDEKSAQGRIPFTYADFLISAKDLRVQNDHQDLHIASANIDPKKLDLQNLRFTKASTNPTKVQTEGKLNRVSLSLDSWEFINRKLALNANSLLVQGADVKVYLPATKSSKNPTPITGLDFPLTIKTISLQDANLNLLKQGNSQIIRGIAVNLSDFQITKESSKKKVPFVVGNYKISFDQYHSKLNKTYSLKTGPLSWTNQGLQIENLEYKPSVSQDQFISRIPVEKDLYDLRAKKIHFIGRLELLQDKKFVEGTSLKLSGVDASIFRSKIPPDDLTIKPMYSALLRKIKIPMHIQNLDIVDSRLVYEEDTKKSDGPGKLVFGSLNLHLDNLNSGQTKSTQIPITIHTRFMDLSPMVVNWKLDTGSSNDQFSIHGNVSELPASSINSFVEPYLKIQTTGYIKKLDFAFTGNRSTLNGNVQMKHQDLKVSILKSTGEKDKLLSAVANLLVKSNSGVYPETVSVDDVQRDQTKSFFNFFWQGIQEGLKKTLIGNNVEKQEVVAKKTVETTKNTVEAVKSDVQNVKKDLNEKINVKKEKPKKKGLFEVFKKKKKE
ncbi:AsmA family protein [Chryseobacterium sp. A321]